MEFVYGDRFVTISVLMCKYKTISTNTKKNRKLTTFFCSYGKRMWKHMNKTSAAVSAIYRLMPICEYPWRGQNSVSHTPFCEWHHILGLASKSAFKMKINEKCRILLKSSNLFFFFDKWYFKTMGPRPWARRCLKFSVTEPWRETVTFILLTDALCVRANTPVCFAAIFMCFYFDLWVEPLDSITPTWRYKLTLTAAAGVYLMCQKVSRSLKCAIMVKL